MFFEKHKIQYEANKFFCDFILHLRDLSLIEIGYYLEKKVIRVIHPLDIQCTFSINITTRLGDRHIIVRLI